MLTCNYTVNCPLAGMAFAGLNLVCRLGDNALENSVQQEYFVSVGQESVSRECVSRESVSRESVLTERCGETDESFF